MALRDACLLNRVFQPVIISESGRALASHHSVIVFDVLSVSQRTAPKFMGNLESLDGSRVQKFTVVDKTAYSGKDCTIVFKVKLLGGPYTGNAIFK